MLYLLKKDELDDKCKRLQTKSDAMEKLSRQLQAERNELKEELKKYETNQTTDDVTSVEAKSPQDEQPVVVAENELCQNVQQEGTQQESTNDVKPTTTDQ